MSEKVYILALESRHTVDGSPQGANYEFRATEAMKRNLVDNQKVARIVSEIDPSGVVKSDSAAAAVPDDLSSKKYNELRTYAADLGLSGQGKSEDLIARIQAHLADGADEEE